MRTNFLGRLLNGLAVLAGVGLMCFAGAASAQTFDDTGYNGSTSRAGGDSPAAHVTVSAPYAVTQISTVSRMAAAHNMKFVIYNLTTSTMMYVSPAKAFGADAAATVKSSDVFAPVILSPGQVYLIGSIADQPGTWHYTSSGTVTQGVVTNTPTNGNFADYGAPASAGCCFGVRVPLRLEGAPPAPVPTMSEWALILFGVMLAGGVALHLHRRRVAA